MKGLAEAGMKVLLPIVKSVQTSVERPRRQAEASTPKVTEKY